MNKRTGNYIIQIDEGNLYREIAESKNKEMKSLNKNRLEFRDDFYKKINRDIEFCKNAIYRERLNHNIDLGNEDEVHAYVLSNDRGYMSESGPHDIVCIGTQEYAEEFFKSYMKKMSSKEFDYQGVVNPDNVEFRPKRGGFSRYIKCYVVKMAGDNRIHFFDEFENIGSNTVKGLEGYLSRFQKIDKFNQKVFENYVKSKGISLNIEEEEERE